MTPRLELALKNASADIRDLLLELGDDLDKAIALARTEAVRHDRKERFGISCSIVLDFDGDKVSVGVGYGLRCKLSKDSTLPNPDQPELPLSSNTTEAAQGESDQERAARIDRARQESAAGAPDLDPPKPKKRGRARKGKAAA